MYEVGYLRGFLTGVVFMLLYATIEKYKKEKER